MSFQETAGPNQPSTVKTRLLPYLRDLVFLVLCSIMVAAESLFSEHGERISSAAAGALVFWAAAGFALGAARRMLLLLHFLVFCGSLALVKIFGVIMIPLALYSLARMCLLSFDALVALRFPEAAQATRLRAGILALIASAIFVVVTIGTAEPVWLVDEQEPTVFVDSESVPADTAD